MTGNQTHDSTFVTLLSSMSVMFYDCFRFAMRSFVPIEGHVLLTGEAVPSPLNLTCHQWVIMFLVDQHVWH